MEDVPGIHKRERNAIPDIFLHITDLLICSGVCNLIDIFVVGENTGVFYVFAFFIFKNLFFFFFFFFFTLEYS